MMKACIFIMQTNLKILVDKAYDPDDPLSTHEGFIIAASGELKSIKYEDHPYYILSYSVGEQGWRVVSLIDKEIIETKVTTLALKITLGFTFVAIFLIFIVYKIVQRSTEPLSFKNIATEITSGNYSMNLSDRDLSRKDEMGELSRSFQIIINSFRK